MVKPIQTRYKGYHFRSRLEARYAVMFDTMGLDWEYEPEGFDLGDAGWYLPDFFIPWLNVWIEVKGGEPTREEMQKCEALSAAFNGDGVATDLTATGDPRFLLEFCKFIDDQEKSGEFPEGSLQEGLNEIATANNQKKQVFIFSGLMKDATLCMGGMSIQCCPYLVFYTAIGDALIANGGVTKKNIKIADSRKKIIKRAVNKARSARFEHGESP